LPSYSEGFPTVVVGAQLAGKVLVGSNVASIREVLCPEMHQLCKLPKDVEGFAAVITELVEKQDWRESLAKQGRRYVMQRHSTERMVDCLQGIYTVNNL
jgi:glycosyltransferase involved in cell wall biosynthesis